MRDRPSTPLTNGYAPRSNKWVFETWGPLCLYLKKVPLSANDCLIFNKHRGHFCPWRPHKCTSIHTHTLKHPLSLSLKSIHLWNATLRCPYSGIISTVTTMGRLAFSATGMMNAHRRPTTHRMTGFNLPQGSVIDNVCSAFLLCACGGKMLSTGTARHIHCAYVHFCMCLDNSLSALCDLKRCVSRCQKCHLVAHKGSNQIRQHFPVLHSSSASIWFCQHRAAHCSTMLTTFVNIKRHTMKCF